MQGAADAGLLEVAGSSSAVRVEAKVAVRDVRPPYDPAGTAVAAALGRVPEGAPVVSVRDVEVHPPRPPPPFGRAVRQVLGDGPEGVARPGRGAVQVRDAIPHKVPATLPVPFPLPRRPPASACRARRRRCRSRARSVGGAPPRQLGELVAPNHGGGPRGGISTAPVEPSHRGTVGVRTPPVRSSSGAT